MAALRKGIKPEPQTQASLEIGYRLHKTGQKEESGFSRCSRATYVLCENAPDETMAGVNLFST
jgi:hypothetical protein